MIPRISLVVVMNGPEAKAGLIPNLSRINGVDVPVKEASMITQIREMATTFAICRSSFHK